MNNRSSGEEHYAGNLSDQTDEIMTSSIDYEAPVSDTQLDWKRVADQQLLDALLNHVHGRFDKSIAASMDAVKTRIQQLDSISAAPGATEDEVTHSGSWNRRTIRWVGLALAASIMLIWLTAVRPWSVPTAMAMIDRAYYRSLEPTDRHYSIEIENGMLGKSGTLYVRGSSRFLLSITGPLGKQTTIARDDQLYWFAPPVGPVFTADSDSVLNNWLDRSTIEMPYLELPTILERIRDRYDFSGNVERPSDSSTTRYHLTASRRDTTTSKDSRKLPDNIELWTDYETGIVQELVLVSRSKFQAGELERRTRLILLDQEKQSEQFFNVVYQNPNRALIPTR